MSNKEIKTGIKKTEIIYEDWDDENRILPTEEVEEGMRKPAKAGEYDEIQIKKKIYHDYANCDECHDEVQKVYAVHRATFISHKCSSCMMKWLDRKEPDFKSELTTELL